MGKKVLRYRREGHETDDTYIAELFTLFKTQMDEETRLYEDKCRKLRENSHKRFVYHQKISIDNTKETETENEKRSKKEKDKDKEKRKNV